jgi:hypothetical protein
MSAAATYGSEAYFCFVEPVVAKSRGNLGSHASKVGGVFCMGAAAPCCFRRIQQPDRAADRLSVPFGGSATAAGAVNFCFRCGQ